jgi:hypothetical protein
METGAMTQPPFGPFIRTPSCPQGLIDSRGF